MTNILTPEKVDKIYKVKETLKEWRVQGKEPTIYLVKLKKDNSLASYEINCKWTVDKISNWKSFKENYTSSEKERYLTISIPLEWNRTHEFLESNTIFPHDLGQVYSGSYKCFDLTEEDALKTLQKSFEDRIVKINERINNLEKSRDNLANKLLPILKKLDKNFK